MFVPADDDVALQVRTLNWPNRIVPILEEAKARIQLQGEKFEDGLRQIRAKFEEDLQQVSEEVVRFDSLCNLERASEYLKELINVKEQTMGLKEQLVHINSQEELFGWSQSRYPTIDKNLGDLEPFELLYTTTSVFSDHQKQFMKGSLLQLKHEAIEKEVGDTARTLFKLRKTMMNKPEPMKLLESSQREIEKFKEHLPLIQCLANPGMRARHWENVSEAVGFYVMPTESTSLLEMVQKKMGDQIKKLEEISDVASKEYSLERSLDKMLSEWQPIEFELGAHEGSGSYILKGGAIDEMQMLLDDHIVKSQAMMASPFAKAFGQRVEDWESFLKTTQEVVDVWLKVQATWQYLQPIFSSEDIMKQMPTEGKLFSNVSPLPADPQHAHTRAHADVHACTHACRHTRAHRPNRLTRAGGFDLAQVDGAHEGEPKGAGGDEAARAAQGAAGRFQHARAGSFTSGSGRFDRLQGHRRDPPGERSMRGVEQVQKGLNDYLETKMLYFPRFFFLSPDDLLEILSETKDPLRVQPHLKKCFEGIAKLDFQVGGRQQTVACSRAEPSRAEPSCVHFADGMHNSNGRSFLPFAVAAQQRHRRDVLGRRRASAVHRHGPARRRAWRRREVDLAGRGPDAPGT